MFWNPTTMIEEAVQDHHPNVPLLQSLAAVFRGEADPATLDVYPEWKAAKADAPS
jgi:hypothetical protein